MNLVDHLRERLTATAPPSAPTPATTPVEELLRRYRDRLVTALPALGTLPTVEQRACVTTMVDGWLAGDDLPSGEFRDQLLVTLVDDIAGFGPLERLLTDPAVTEVMVNGPDDIYVERAGVIESTDARFRDAEHVRTVVERLLLGSGRRLDESSPMVDARLHDGSRLNAVLPPVAVHGPLVTIRRPSAQRLSIDVLVREGSLDGVMAAFLHAAILGRCTIVVTGGTGAGKTTLLGALAALIPRRERIVTLEDVAELRIDHPHIASQECRPAGEDGPAPVTLRDLVRNSLRMRPDRLLVGEVRGSEAADMVMAMNTGHEGSMATVHANTAVDGIGRLEAMLALAWPGLPIETLRSWLANAVDLIVHCERTPSGRRYVATIAAVELDEMAIVTVTPLFRQDEGSPGAQVVRCGEVPRQCLERMARHGVRFPPALFAAA